MSQFFNLGLSFEFMLKNGKLFVIFKIFLDSIQ